MSEECLICKAPLVYLEEDEMMECVFCHQKQMSKTRCVNGHFVCDACHSKGLDQMLSVCLNSQSKNPLEIIEAMMALKTCHMHGPEHHTMVGAALLCAYKNAGGKIDLQKALLEMQKRGQQVPGGACGFWGACGAGISTGIYISIITKATPLQTKAWSLANLMTSKALAAISENGGPRCCKRDSYLAILTAIAFTKEHFNIEMAKNPVICSRSHLNNQCRKEECLFYKPKK